MCCYKQYMATGSKWAPPLSGKPPLCACGCGEHVVQKPGRRAWNAYLHNHHLRGKHRPHTAETRAKISAATREQFKNNHPTRGKKVLASSIAKRGACNPNAGKFGPDSPNWKGGRTHHRGYVSIRKPDHPNARRGYVYEHHLVVEHALGRYLKKGEEVVHHVNGKKSDNQLENLYVTDRSGHRIAHDSAFAVVCQLLASGAVIFDHSTGKYACA